MEHGDRKVVSRRFQFVEVTADGDVIDPGAEPYLNYEPDRPTMSGRCSGTSTCHWADDGIDETARSWATANLATPHFAEVATWSLRLGSSAREGPLRNDSTARSATGMPVPPS